MTFSLSLPSQLPSFSYIHPSRRLRRVSLHFRHFIPSFQCNTHTPTNPSHMHIQITQEIIVWEKKIISALPKCEGIPGNSSNCVSNTYQRGLGQLRHEGANGSPLSWAGKDKKWDLKKGVQSAEISFLCRNSALCCGYKAELKLWAWPSAPRGQQTLSSHMTKDSVRPGENSKLQIHQ